MENYIQIKTSHLFYISLILCFFLFTAIDEEEAKQVDVGYETEYISGMQYRIYQSTESGDIDIINVTRDEAETEYYEQEMK